MTSYNNSVYRLDMGLGKGEGESISRVFHIRNDWIVSIFLKIFGYIFNNKTTFTVAFGLPEN